MKRIIHLVRHGHVENPKRVIYGRLPDFHLSQRGREEAFLAGESIIGRNITRIVASPLDRAQETARIIGVSFDLPTDTDDRLIEIASPLEGTRWKKVFNLKTIGLLADQESNRAIADRMITALRYQLSSTSGELLVVSHQGCILALRYALRGRSVPLPSYLTKCATGSVETIELDMEDIRYAA